MKPYADLRESARSLTNTRSLVVASMLLAVQVALGLVASINIADYLRVSFGYLALAACGMLLGPIPAAINGALADLLLCLLKPSGPYFPGFTVSAMLTGLVYGFALYKREAKLKNVVAAKLVIDLAINLGLGTLWITLLYGKGFWVIFPARALKQLAQFPIDVALLLVALPLVREIESHGR